MGNAARKARKAAGIKFQHPVKEATPLPMRQGQSRRSKMNHMEAAIMGAGDPKALGLDWATMMGYTKEGDIQTGMSAGKSKTGAAMVDLELDPKPFRIGRRRFVDYLDAKADESPGDEIIFSPRTKYEQNMIKYPDTLFEARYK